MANAYGSARGDSARYAAVQGAAAQVAVDRARAAAPYVPAPPKINYVQGVAPGHDQAADATAEAVGAAQTVYYQTPMDGFTRGHEAGHIFDYEVLSDGDRAYFQRLLHTPAGAWRTGTGTGAGMHSPNEAFADYYGAAATHLDPAKRTVSSYVPIGPKRLKRFEAALARLGKRHNLKPYS